MSNCLLDLWHLIKICLALFQASSRWIVERNRSILIKLAEWRHVPWYSVIFYLEMSNHFSWWTTQMLHTVMIHPSYESKIVLLGNQLIPFFDQKYDPSKFESKSDARGSNIWNNSHLDELPINFFVFMEFLEFIS